MSVTSEVRALYLQGYEDVAIRVAMRQRVTPSSLRSIMSRARSSLKMVDRPPGRQGDRVIVIGLPAPLHELLAREAANRRLTAPELVARIVTATISDDMVDAVLDDGETS